MKEIGGYFELELKDGQHYHARALRLNTARNCFEYILRTRRYSKVYIPYYTCQVMLEPLQKCGVGWEYYPIGADLEPLTKFHLHENEAFLYTNYFGLKQSCVQELSECYGKLLIVDNSQAFFASPVPGIDTFYSARKLFGVPDGGYLYTDTLLNQKLEQDVSHDRMSNLLIRLDVGAEVGYRDFIYNESLLANNPIKVMSRLTDRILASVDYELIAQKRWDNFNYLNSLLGGINELKLSCSLQLDSVPMVYPFLFEKNKKIRSALISQKIFVAKYWDNVLSWISEQQKIELFLVENLLPIPIDQRYNAGDMERIVKVINEYTNNSNLI